MPKKFKVTDHIPPYQEDANCQRCNTPKAADFGTEVLCVECVQKDVFEPVETNRIDGHQWVNVVQTSTNQHKKNWEQCSNCGALKPNKNKSKMVVVTFNTLQLSLHGQ